MGYGDGAFNYPLQLQLDRRDGAGQFRDTVAPDEEFGAHAVRQPAGRSRERADATSIVGRLLACNRAEQLFTGRGQGVLTNCAMIEECQ